MFVPEYPAYTQGDTAGEIIRHQQYLFISPELKTGTLSRVAPLVPPLAEPQNTTPWIGISPQVIDQFEPEAELPGVQVVDDVNLTHFTTAPAGRIVAIHINPVINKYFFIFLSPVFPLKEKPPKIFRWLEFKNN